MTVRPPSSRSGLPGSPATIVADDRSEVGRIAGRARRLRRMKSVLWPLLPADVQPYCELANYRNGVIVTTATSPVWAARLRQFSPRILHTARERLQIRAERLEVRVVPREPEATTVRRPRQLSVAARRALERAASGCRDEALEAAFRRFLERR